METLLEFLLKFPEWKVNSLYNDIIWKGPKEKMTYVNTL